MENRGFSLIEVLIVVAIIGILAAIAYPSYQRYTVKTQRTNVQSELLRLSQKMQSYKLVNHSYKQASLQKITGSSKNTFPQNGNALYTIAVDVKDAQSYVITATPINGTRQQDDGVVCINEEGYRYWEQGKNSCNLSATSKWSDD